MKLDTERRRYKRLNHEALITHDVTIDGDIHRGRMLNFSKGGLYFESDQTIYPGEEIFVAFAIHAGASGKVSQLLLEVKVLWHTVLKDSPRRYGYGGKFLSIHDASIETGYIRKEAVEKKATGNLDFQGENDSRKYFRKPFNKSVRFFYGSHEYKGILTDIGRGGAFILTKEPFVLGARIKFVIPPSKTRKAVAATGWIVRISLDGIGISFERRAGRERRSDLDRRTGYDRRGRDRRNPGS